MRLLGLMPAQMTVGLSTGGDKGRGKKGKGGGFRYKKRRKKKRDDILFWNRWDYTCTFFVSRIMTKQAVASVSDSGNGGKKKRQVMSPMQLVCSLCSISGSKSGIIFRTGCYTRHV